jgi:RsiW-degrading membrane proteinase PrsW (M82 family)
MGLLLSVLLGFLPMIFFAWLVYWLDRYEKEPGPLLGGVFFWGALAAAGGAFLINTVLGVGIYLFTNSTTASELATGVLIAPAVEEILKGLAVLAIFLLAREEFDSLLDGVVYAGIAALGFAASENVFYIYGMGYAEHGLGGLVWMAFVRIMLVGWQHPFYTAFFGIGLAAARLSRRPEVKILAPMAGLALGMTLHSLHNLVGTAIHSGAGLAVGALFDWSGWSLMLLFILWATRREQGWISAQLREEVGLGRMTVDQYRTACSAWAQGWARLGGLLSGKFRATSRFYQVCGELAYKKHQRSTLGEEGGNSRRIEALRQELARLSPLAQG